MNQQTLEDLSDRVARLERAARWWRIVSASALAALGFLACTEVGAQRLTDEVRAKRFVVVGADGRDRSRWGPGSGANSTVLQFLDKEGEDLVRIGVVDGKEDGREVGILSLTDRKGSLASVLPRGVSLLGDDDKDGKIIWSAP